MSLGGLVDGILGLPGWLVLLIAGLVVFAEDALFVGFVLPGETVAVLAGASARLGHVSLAEGIPVGVRPGGRRRHGRLPGRSLGRSDGPGPEIGRAHV